MAMSRDNDQKRKECPYMEMSRDNDVYKSNEMQLQNHSLTFIHESNFQLPAFFLVQPWLTTLQKPWTNWLAPTMWTLANVKTDLDDFLGPKMTPTTWISN